MGGKLFAARRVSRGIRARGESIRGYRKVGQITAKSRTTLASRRGGCRTHSNRVVEEARSGDAKARVRAADLGAFLKAYDLICRSIVDMEDFHRVTYEMLARCTASGARYVEFFFSPQATLRHGVAYSTI